MDDPRLPRLLYAVLFVAGLVMMAYYYPQMPERMASHFAADGSVNGWQTREAFFALILLVTSTSALVSFVAPRQIAANADHRINLPHRSYWLAPERRAESMSFISATMAWFGCGILFVLIYGTRLAVQANLGPEHRLNSHAMILVLAGFLAGMFGLIFRMVRHFQKVPISG